MEGGQSVASGISSISFHCGDTNKTVSELKEQDAEFTDAVTDVGYGLAIHFKLPGGFTVELYQLSCQCKTVSG